MAHGAAEPGLAAKPGLGVCILGHALQFGLLRYKGCRTGWVRGVVVAAYV